MNNFLIPRKLVFGAKPIAGGYYYQVGVIGPNRIVDLLDLAMQPVASARLSVSLDGKVSAILADASQNPYTLRNR